MWVQGSQEADEASPEDVEGQRGSEAGSPGAVLAGCGAVVEEPVGGPLGAGESAPSMARGAGGVEKGLGGAGQDTSGRVQSEAGGWVGEQVT